MIVREMVTESDLELANATELSRMNFLFSPVVLRADTHPCALLQSRTRCELKFEK